MFNNKVAITGTVSSEVIFDHTSHETNFYKFHLNSNRLSNNFDVIPIIFSAETFNKEEITLNSTFTVVGEYRSFNFHDEHANTHLLLNVFANEIIKSAENIPQKHTNLVELNGYICKPPIFRTTPLNRKICDILLAVNRSFNKSDYIPCILWGKNAEICKDLKVGTNVELIGRIQSREYQKKISEEISEKKMAYEVSVAKLTVV